MHEPNLVIGHVISAEACEGSKESSGRGYIYTYIYIYIFLDQNTWLELLMCAASIGRKKKQVEPVKENSQNSQGGPVSTLLVVNVWSI